MITLETLRFHGLEDVFQVWKELNTTTSVKKFNVDGLEFNLPAIVGGKNEQPLEFSLFIKGTKLTMEFILYPFSNTLREIKITEWRMMKDADGNPNGYRLRTVTEVLPRQLKQNFIDDKCQAIVDVLLLKSTMLNIYPTLKEKYGQVV